MADYNFILPPWVMEMYNSERSGKKCFQILNYMLCCKGEVKPEELYAYIESEEEEETNILTKLVVFLWMAVLDTQNDKEHISNIIKKYIEEKD